MISGEHQLNTDEVKEFNGTFKGKTVLIDWAPNGRLPTTDRNAYLKFISGYIPKWWQISECITYKRYLEYVQQNRCI